MDKITCPVKDDDGTVCGQRVELTRKTYMHIDEESGRVEESIPGASYDVYCQNDHPLGENFEDIESVRRFLRTYNT